MSKNQKINFMFNSRDLRWKFRKAQKKHDLRDIAFEEGDLCNADIRTAFIEYNAAMRHTKLGTNSRHNSLSNSHKNKNSKLRGGEATKNNRNKNHDVSL